MLNSIVLMGRLTADPELMSTQSNVSVCSFTIAVDRDYSGGDEKQTDFIDVVTWRQTAEFVSRYFSKGRTIVVQGSLQSRKWQDKYGNNRISWEVQANKVWFGDSKSSDSKPGPEKSKKEEAPPKERLETPSETFSALPDDDLPF